MPHAEVNGQRLFFNDTGGDGAPLAERDDISDRLGEIRVPAVVLHGDQDFAISADRAQALADGLGDAQLFLIEGAGHASNLTHPELVNPRIARFPGTVVA